jgi:hypothetical protein
MVRPVALQCTESLGFLLSTAVAIMVLCELLYVNVATVQVFAILFVVQATVYICSLVWLLLLRDHYEKNYDYGHQGPHASHVCAGLAMTWPLVAITWNFITRWSAATIAVLDRDRYSSLESLDMSHRTYTDFRLIMYFAFVVYIGIIIVFMPSFRRHFRALAKPASTAPARQRGPSVR